MADRETLLAETFVALADTMVNDFDVVDFLSLLSNRCVDLFDAGDAGLMLDDGTGRLVVIASSSHKMHDLELFELQHDEGPCPEAFQSGLAVQCGDLAEATGRWPKFAPEAVNAGFRSVHALPMRLRNDVIGALNLIRTVPGPLPDEDLEEAQALANVATIGILHNRAVEESRLLSEQLQHALNSRIVIEQATGVIAQRLDLEMEEAFNRLRRYSRDNNRRLIDTAKGIVDRSLVAPELTER